MKGEALFDQAQTFTGSNPAPGMPREWDPDATRDLFGGLQYNATNGFYFGAGARPTPRPYFLHRSDFTTSEDSDFDRLGLQVRLGYYPGVRVYAPPPTVTPTAPPTPRRAAQPRRRR